MAYKTVKILVNETEFDRLVQVLDRNHDLNGVIGVVGLISRDDKNEVELEINGMMTYDLWNRFCAQVGIHVPYPGY